MSDLPSAMHCQRTREWLSLALDGTPSQFESALVQAHVARCPDCRSFDAAARWLSGTLRSAVDEPLPSPVSLPHRRFGVSRFRIVRLGSALAAAAGVFLAVAVLPERSPFAPPERSLIAAPLLRPATTNDLMVAVRAPALERGERAALAFGTGGVGTYKPLLSTIPG